MKFHNKYLICSIVSCLVLFFSTTTIAQPEYKPDEGKVFTNLVEALKNPDEVTRLRLRRQKFTRIPKEIYLFKNLVELDLTGNRLTEISDSIGLLTNLVYLNLERNNLQSLPKGLSKLTKLKYLNIGKNKISTFDKSIVALTQLEYIQAWGNDLIEIPDEFYQLKSLKYLDLRAIIITDDQREEMVKIIPNTTIYFSPSCNCKN